MLHTFKKAKEYIKRSKHGDFKLGNGLRIKWLKPNKTIQLVYQLLYIDETDVIHITSKFNNLQHYFRMDIVNALNTLGIPAIEITAHLQRVVYGVKPIPSKYIAFIPHNGKLMAITTDTKFRYGQPLNLSELVTISDEDYKAVAKKVQKELNAAYTTALIMSTETASKELDAYRSKKEPIPLHIKIKIGINHGRSPQAIKNEYRKELMHKYLSKCALTTKLNYEV